MKYGQLAGSMCINTMIYHCFEWLSEDDVRKFVRKFREQPHDSDQIMHTFRELILGAYLGSKGFSVRHDFVIGGKTPDWCIFDDEQKVVCVVELTNFHIDKATENEIERQRQVSHVVSYWRDTNKDNVLRLYYSIENKAQKYRILLENLKVPYIVCVFGESTAAIDFDEVCQCLFGEDMGLFAAYSAVSGVLFFDESSGRYSFRYIRNPNSYADMDLREGYFSTDQI